MRLSRTDLVPVLAIIGGGAVGVLASSALALRSPTDDARVFHLEFEIAASPETDARAALRARQEEARRVLFEALSARALLNVEKAIELVEELQSQQGEVTREVRGLPRQPTERSDAQIERLRERKEQMAEAVQDLERELDRAASVWETDNPEASRALREAAELIRESKLVGELQFSKATVGQWDLPFASTLELNIVADFQVVRDRLELFLTPAGSTAAPLIYIDGVRISSALSRREEVFRLFPVTVTPYTFMEGLDPADIERIKVWHGPAASKVYGEEASGGVIEVWLKEPGQPTGR